MRQLMAAVGLVAVAAACREAAGPITPDSSPAVQASTASQADVQRSAGQMNFLKQKKDAPQLETYRATFWAVRGRARTIRVRYLDPATGRPSEGAPFLQFDVPENALVSGANGARLRRGDSVLVTVSIDPRNFVVDFSPDGVQYDPRSPAQLRMWYYNADPDLNGDGVTDTSDRATWSQVSVWYAANSWSPWVKVGGTNDPASQSFATPVYHFSGYAISW